MNATLPSCSREVGNYHPLADQPESRPQPTTASADTRLSPNAHARGGAGRRLEALGPAPPGELGIGAARSQSSGSAFGSESFRKLRCAALCCAGADHWRSALKRLSCYGSSPPLNRPPGVGWRVSGHERPQGLCSCPRQ